MFTVPYFNSRYFLPLIWVGIFLVLYYWDPPELHLFAKSLHPANTAGNSSPGSSLSAFSIQHFIRLEFPIFLFAVAALILTIASIWKQLSLIPVLGLLTNFYLMAQLGITNWMRFIIWLVIGLVIYFTFGRKHSKLKEEIRSQRSEL